MGKNIQYLIDISRKYGCNPEYVLAGGGNTSYKDEEKIWVKASGTSMAGIDEQGFVCLDREKLNILSTRIYSANSSERENQVKQDLSKAILFPEDKRPSVETSMHEIIRFPYIVHTHPTLVNGLLCARNSREVVSQLFGDDVLYIEYTDPGYILFKGVDHALKGFRNKNGFEPSIIFLENHGVFVGANSIDEINEIYLDIETRIKNNISRFPKTSENREDETIMSVGEILRQHNQISNFVTTSQSNDLTTHFVKDETAFKKVAIPFTPDNIVYCKSNYLFIKDKSELIKAFSDFKLEHGYHPKVIAIQGLGLLALEENIKSARIVMDVFTDMLKVSYLSENFGGPRPMTRTQIDFIDNWEVENYRRQVSKSN